MYKIMYEMIISYDANVAQIDHFIVSDDKIFDRVHINENHVYLEENMKVKSNIEDELIDSFTWDKLSKKELFVGFEFINLSYHKDLIFICIL